MEGKSEGLGDGEKRMNGWEWRRQKGTGHEGLLVGGGNGTEIWEMGRKM
jgi:hypothetical protein